MVLLNDSHRRQTRKFGKPAREVTTSYNLKHWPAVLVAMSPAHNDAHKVENALKL